jgi:hypothetical protein
MSKLVRPRIELLPNEMWLEIFSYTLPSDLYCAWWNLNSHINLILRSLRISIYITSKSKDNTHYKNTLTRFPLQTVSVKDERWDTMTSSQSWPVDLLALANIRSLYLAHCSQEQFKQLVNRRQLTRLSLPCDSPSWDFLERFVLNKEGEERFPQLYSIGRIWCEDTNSKRSSSNTINTTIRHIHLVVPSCRSTVNFIQDLPELSSITVDYLGNEVGFSSSCFISAKIRRQHEGGLKNISPKKDPPWQPMDEKNLPLVTIAPRVYRLRINFLGQCDFVGLARILQ